MRLFVTGGLCLFSRRFLSCGGRSPIACHVHTKHTVTQSADCCPDALDDRSCRPDKVRGDPNGRYAQSPSHSTAYL